MGIIGNFLLICILIQQTHRRNSCSIYLLSIATVNIILILYLLPLAVSAADKIDPQNSTLSRCKFHSYLFNVLLMLCCWFRIAACLDRVTMFSHHARIRSFSQTYTAYRVITIMTCFCLLKAIHFAIYFHIESGRCIPQPGVYKIFLATYTIVITRWLPPVFMIVCSVILYQNLKKIRSRVSLRNLPHDHILVKNHQRIGRRDQQTIVLLVCEIVIYVSTNTLYSVSITYTAIAYGHLKSASQIVIEAFLAYGLSPFIFIIHNCALFYLYLLVSSKFRKDFKSLLIRYYGQYRPIRT